MTPPSFEKVSASVVSMDRSQLCKKIKGFKGSFKFDFSESFLKDCSEDKLRHILLAAIMTKR